MCFSRRFKDRHFVPGTALNANGDFEFNLQGTYSLPILLERVIADSNDADRLNVYNGFLLTANMDALFDIGVFVLSS